MFAQAQAPFPMHSGGARYRLYYGNTADQAGKANSNLPFLGPKVLIYGDGSVSGAPDTVEFEDWEAQAAARDVVFLWPDGTRWTRARKATSTTFTFSRPPAASTCKSCTSRSPMERLRRSR